MASKKTRRPKSAVVKARATRKAKPSQKASPARRASSRKASPRKASLRKAPARKTSASKAPTRKVPAKKKRAAPKKPPLQTMTHPVFGRVTADPVEGLYWHKTLRLADRDVAVDLTIDDPAEVTMELLDSAAQLVSRLAHFDALARARLRESHEEDSTSEVALYVKHHLQELSAETLLRIFEKPRESIGADDVLARLLLKRVGSYPAKSGGSATFDYTIGAEESQYVLAVQLDESGAVVGIAMES
jgi:hypothetical protein